MKTEAVIGCGYGDEGKGKVVSLLCSEHRSVLVIRYCGGHQAGHHVMLKNGVEHVFSNFGSGTLQNADTYWSKYCTVDPVGIMNELDVLLHKKAILSKLYIDPRCPITTPYEKLANIKKNNETNHGSCGVGFGQTLQREEDHHSILAEDLNYPSVLKIKLKLLEEYYKIENLYEEVQIFLKCCKEVVDSYKVFIQKPVITEKYYSKVVFEGSQGLLLDQNMGFFPHVTRSNTGTKNILNILKEIVKYNPKIQVDPYVYLVTRAYQTRHGNGPMTNEHLPKYFKIDDNPYEQNFDTSYQGKFRKAYLDLDMLKYAINKDRHLKDNTPHLRLVVTCLDLMKEYKVSIDGSLHDLNSEEKFINVIKNYLGLRSDNIFLSRTPYPEAERSTRT